MDYLDFFGLTQEPFSMAPVSRFYFNSSQHSRALVRLMYAVDTMKGLAVLIGDIGSGKTTLARRMLEALPEEEYESALLVIIHSGITADWLLERIALQLGVKEPAKEKLKLLNQLYKRLVELHSKGKKSVVLIDEAQMLQSREIMEEFRGLLNLELPEKKLITFVFFGLPDIEECLKLDPPLAQRVALKYTLEPFNEESAKGYIQHRLRLAGSHEEIFDDEACVSIHHHARGIPRLINTICDNALFEGYLLKQKKIDAKLVSSVVSDLGLAHDEVAEEEGPALAGVAPKEQGSHSKHGPKSAAAAQSKPHAAARSSQHAAKQNSDVDKVLDEFNNIIEDDSNPPKKKATEKKEVEESEIDSMLDDLEEK